MARNEEEFFIGWQGKAPEETGRFLRGRVIVILLAVLAVGAGLAGLQETIGRAWHDFPAVREFSGVLVAEPVPMLLTDGPDEASGESVFLLTRPFKHGFEMDLAEAWHLKRVSLKGTLVHREDGAGVRAMIEVEEDSLEDINGPVQRSPLAEKATMRPVTLRGEIVDSKCYLGVMNPGNLKAHRACAINCIKGGIPPILLVRTEDGRAEHFLLVGPEGENLGEEVIAHVALPVEITGVVERLDGRVSVLRAAAEEVKRLGGGRE